MQQLLRIAQSAGPALQRAGQAASRVAVRAGQAIGRWGTAAWQWGRSLFEAARGLSPEMARLALPASRLQHASRHLIEEGILPRWSKATGQQFTELATKILTSPLKTFEHVAKRGGETLQGFFGKVDGKPVVIFLYKTGELTGKISHAIKPTIEQMKNWSLK